MTKQVLDSKGRRRNRGNLPCPLGCLCRKHLLRRSPYQGPGSIRGHTKFDHPGLARMAAERRRKLASGELLHTGGWDYFWKHASPEKIALRNARVSAGILRSDSEHPGVRAHGTPCTEARKRGISEGVTAFYQTEEGKDVKRRALEKFTPTMCSELKTRLMLEGKFSPGAGKWYKAQNITTKKGGSFRARSSWEVEYAKKLDGDPTVIEFLHEAVRVPYWWRGERHFTVIDFFVRRTYGIELIEVKPESRVNLRERVKFQASTCFAERYGFVFYWWDGGRLRSLEEVRTHA